MAWTKFIRRRYERSGGRYASDAEWALVAPLMPARKRVGRPHTTLLAILCMATIGCQWWMLPNDFPPVSTVRRYFHDGRDNDLLEELNRHLVAAARQAEGRAADPSAGVIDSQSVKTTQSGEVRGHDAGKRIKGRKRHIVTDIVRFLVGLAVQGADVQDHRVGAGKVGRQRFAGRIHIVRESHSDPFASQDRHPTEVGRQVFCGLRQSMPSSRYPGRAGVIATARPPVAGSSAAPASGATTADIKPARTAFATGLVPGKQQAAGKPASARCRGRKPGAEQALFDDPHLPGNRPAPPAPGIHNLKTAELRTGCKNIHNDTQLWIEPNRKMVPVGCLRTECSGRLSVEKRMGQGGGQDKMVCQSSRATPMSSGLSS